MPQPTHLGSNSVLTLYNHRDAMIFSTLSCISHSGLKLGKKCNLGKPQCLPHTLKSKGFKKIFFEWSGPEGPFDLK